MDVYNVGPCELSSYETDQIKARRDYNWLIVWYEQGSYEGSGLAVGLRTDGKVDFYNLDHCSCYGPTEGEAYDTKNSLYEASKLLSGDEIGKPRTPQDYDYAQWSEVNKKFREIANIAPDKLDDMQ